MCRRELYLFKYICKHSQFDHEKKIDCAKENCFLSASHSKECGNLCTCQRYQNQPIRIYYDVCQLFHDNGYGH